MRILASRTLGSLDQRGSGSSWQDRSCPFKDTEALDQLAPGTKQARPLDQAKQFERRSNPLTAPKRFLDQTLCLVHLARLEAERAERQDGIKEAEVLRNTSSTCRVQSGVRLHSCLSQVAELEEAASSDPQQHRRRDWVGVTEGHIACRDAQVRVFIVEMGPCRKNRELVEDKICAGSQAREDISLESKNGIRFAAHAVPLRVDASQPDLEIDVPRRRLPLEACASHQPCSSILPASPSARA